MQFSDIPLHETLQLAIEQEGYATPTPIQQRAIPPVLEGRDLLGVAQTGTGKTAAFALPILHRLGLFDAPAASQAEAPRHGRRPGRASAPQASRPAGNGRPIRVLVLTPTRELALQVNDSFRTYGKHTSVRTLAVFGGVGQRPQEDALSAGVDVLVACPGRLLDLMGQGLVDLTSLEVFILDEADRMLDMGFITDIRKIVARIPKRRQTLFFSATMPDDIRTLAGDLLHDPVHVAVAAVSSAAETVDQSIVHVEKSDKQAALHAILADVSIRRALVFTRTKHGADRVARRLGRIEVVAEAIHGDKSQSSRVRALENFRAGRTRVLVASDIASRGLDIEEISHVVNFDLPAEPETYVHRIGRTGRAGAEGRAISFCSSDEKQLLDQIERLIDRRIPRLHLGPLPKVADGPREGGRREAGSRDEMSRGDSGEGRSRGEATGRSGDGRSNGGRSRRGGRGSEAGRPTAHAGRGGASSQGASGKSRGPNGESATGGRRGEPGKGARQGQSGREERHRDGRTVAYGQVDTGKPTKSGFFGKIIDRLKGRPGR